MRSHQAFHLAVRDVMTPTPKTVTPQTTYRELLALFALHDVNAFPVVDEDGVLHGIVSKLDLLRAFLSNRPVGDPEQTGLATVPAERIMRPGIVNLERDDPAITAMELMVETRLHSLPVVRRGSGSPRLVGMITRGDLLRALLVERQEPAGSTTARGRAGAGHP